VALRRLRCPCCASRCVRGHDVTVLHAALHAVLHAVLRYMQLTFNKANTFDGHNMLLHGRRQHSPVLSSSACCMLAY
jgi:hypothetical protein